MSAPIRKKYESRALLRRQAKNGMMRLGGGNASMLLYPGRDKWKGRDHERFHAIGLRPAMGYENNWQPSGPKYAGADGFVSAVPIYGKLFSLFMKRVAKSKLLGWEYCGEYTTKLDRDDDDADVEAEIDESDLGKIYGGEADDGPADDDDKPLHSYQNAKNVSEASKRAIVKCMHLSLSRKNGWATDHLSECKKKVIEALKKDKGNCHPDKMVVYINEFHCGYAVRFVKYDEKVYDFVKGGAYDRSAADWYAYLDSQASG
jgi:hypothetical protein